MDSPAFAVTGMFSAVKVGNSAFTTDAVTPVTKTSTAAVRMVVDPFQRKFQSIGKINVDYSRPKKLATYKRSGASDTFEFPNSPAQAGHYSITNCNKPTGAQTILRKYDEYCAKGMVQVYKRSAIPYGVYTPKCTEATQHLVAFDTRTFSRTTAFKQAQKPTNIRLREAYEARKNCFILAHNCDREEQQFKSMPQSCATYLAAKSEAHGTCSRLVLPTNKAEDYMAGSIKAQMYAKSHPSGVFANGSCTDGFAKNDAETRRVIALNSEFRASQQSAATVTRQQYESSRVARELFTKDCHYEEELVYTYPAAGAALIK